MGVFSLWKFLHIYYLSPIKELNTNQQHGKEQGRKIFSINRRVLFYVPD